MSDDKGDALARANRWSQVLAIFAALGGYVAGSLLVGSVELGLILAASIGIGVRIFVPYQVSRSVTEEPGTTLSDHPVTGNYNYGAVGLSLLLGPVFVILVGLFEPNLQLAIGIGVVATVLLFLILQFTLPK